MNLNLQEGVALATELNAALAADKPNCDVVICTPFIHLASVAAVLDAQTIGLGAENCADKEKRRIHRRGVCRDGKIYRCAVCHSGTFGASCLLRRDCRNPERESKLGFGKRPEGHLLYR